MTKQAAPRSGFQDYLETGGTGKVPERVYESPEVPETEPIIRATRAELANGWDDMTLSRYVMERDIAAAEKIDPHHPSRRPRNPQRAKTGYSPFTWRRKPTAG